MAENYQLVIDGCKKQREQSQLEFYKLFYKAVYNSCFRILRRQEEAEEAMQDTFIKAFDNISSLNIGTHPEPWLKRIAINTSIDRLRKKKQVLLELNSNTEIEEEETESYDDKLLKVEAIKKGIELLPQGFRLVLGLHLIEEYSFEEVAKTLQISASTVRSQYVRGRARLREMLISNQ